MVESGTDPIVDQ